MFERFTRDARTVVHLAATSAQETGSDVDSVDLLLALAWLDSGSDGTTAARVLRTAGLDRPTLERAAAQVRPAPDDGAANPRPNPTALDGDALAVLGVDLDSIRERADFVFGPGALDVPVANEGSQGRRRRARFTPDAKKALELALREAVRLRDKQLTSIHLLLGVLRDVDSPARRALAVTDVDLVALRNAAEGAIASRAA
jgi:ATP-dependent Clp protease ATP-binding subunit ClpA